MSEFLAALQTSDLLNIIMGLIVAVVMAITAAVSFFTASRGPKVPPVFVGDPDDLPDWETICGKEECVAAEIRLTNARNELVAACTRYKAQERVKNNRHTIYQIALGAVATLLALAAAAGFFSRIGLLIAAAIAGIAAAVAKVKLEQAKSKLDDLQKKYDVCVAEFREAVDEVHKNCNHYCWKTMNRELPVCL